MKCCTIVLIGLQLSDLVENNIAVLLHFVHCGCIFVFVRKFKENLVARQS